ncbi:MAG: DegT/DnrJ/EryC1/StrS family aminotransferase [Flavobacteriales bacterium]|nr:DegT/DnrJ/EryC1/StrS family aminotransferase [Flavobacteriales bacterium]
MKKTKNINQIEPLVSKEDAESVYEYLKSGAWVTEHKVTNNFEEIIKNRVGRKYAIAVPNGTMAIYLSLLASGIKKGDRVAIPNLTMIATINAVLWIGAEPILVDVNESLCMSYEKLVDIKKLSAVIYVPLNGRTEDGLVIEKWCKQNGILLIEDSAHALGSKYNSLKNCGQLGEISILSLTPHKLITTGQGGVILLDKLKHYNEAMKIKTFNRRKDKLDWHDGFGLNFKFTDLQATLGISQLNSLDNRIRLKREILKKYSLIDTPNFKLGEFKEYELPWFFDLFANNQKNLKKLWNRLKSVGIETRQLYPALSKQKYLLNVEKTDLSLSESVFNKVLWLPSSINLTESDLKYISESINYEI